MWSPPPKLFLHTVSNVNKPTHTLKHRHSPLYYLDLSDIHSTHLPFYVIDLSDLSGPSSLVYPVHLYDLGHLGHRSHTDHLCHIDHLRHTDHHTDHLSHTDHLDHSSHPDQRGSTVHLNTIDVYYPINFTYSCYYYLPFRCRSFRVITSFRSTVRLSEHHINTHYCSSQTVNIYSVDPTWDYSVPLTNSIRSRFNNLHQWVE